MEGGGVRPASQGTPVTPQADEGSGLVLAFDTATEICTVSLHRPDGNGQACLAHRTEQAGRSHTRILLCWVDRLMRDVGAEPKDLSGIVVGTGPGTFTGVRIGVSTARALALSLGIPVEGLSTLSVLAARALADAAGGVREAVAVVPLVDARRGQLFATVYRREASMWRRSGSYFTLFPDEVAQLAESYGLDLSTTVFVGETRSLAGNDLLVAPLEVDSRYLLSGQELLLEPGASQAAVIRPRRAGGSAPGEEGSPESVLPLYVRRPDADIHIQKMRDVWS